MCHRLTSFGMGAGARPRVALSREESRGAARGRGLPHAQLIIRGRGADEARHVI